MIAKCDWETYEFCVSLKYFHLCGMSQKTVTMYLGEFKPKAFIQAKLHKATQTE
jgi:hypothetical protein